MSSASHVELSFRSDLEPCSRHAASLRPQPVAALVCAASRALATSVCPYPVTGRARGEKRFLSASSSGPALSAEVRHTGSGVPDPVEMEPQTSWPAYRRTTGRGDTANARIAGRWLTPLRHPT